MPEKRTLDDSGILESKGWRKVEVGDEFLLGSGEFGFMELEELDPAAAGEAQKHAVLVESVRCCMPSLCVARWSRSATVGRLCRHLYCGP